MQALLLVAALGLLAAMLATVYATASRQSRSAAERAPESQR
jgi:hypothetical protein